MAKLERLASLGEFGWLKKLLPRLYWPSKLYPQLCIGPGDDAGVLRITPGRVLVTSTDAMVEGIHFERKWFSWEALGAKILAVNLSDLAAMGKVKPLAALVTVAFPGDTPVDSVDKFYKGLESCAQRWKTGLLGGDTVGSKKGWFVSVTVFGEADPKQLLKRRGARAGDLLVVSGPLGLAGAGLEFLQSGRPQTAWAAPLLKAFNAPEPRFNEAGLLAEQRWATSLMDCSDGLEASARLLAEASELGVEIDFDALPIAPALARWARLRRKDAGEYALGAGEDYALVFTVPSAKWPVLRRRLPRARVVGRMTPRGSGGWVVLPSGRRPIAGYGFAHFKL